VLLLGGTGILSTEICSIAIERGYEVTIVNRGNRKNRINLQANLIIGNLKEESIEVLREKLNGEDFDVVVDFITYDVRQLKRSIEMISGICKQYIFISSATTYLDADNNLPLTENSPIGNTGWKYSLDKAQCEWYLQENKEQFSFAYTIIRPYVTYGKTRIPYQVIPIEYYTLINRIMLNKPIPIFGENVRCTLTNASEFAVGTVGLFKNQKAFGEAVHITADTTTTWKEVIKELGGKLEREVILVDLPLKCLDKGSLKLGFDVDEIRYDKGRTMVFCNEKIKRLVPEFKGSITLSQGIDASLDYFKENYYVRKINYAWDARIDRLLAQYSTPNKGLNLSGYGKSCSLRERLIYTLNRYDFLYYISKLIAKCYRKIRCRIK